jgi:hypothetical protein
MKQCDICLKQTEEELYNLLESYQTAYIKHVCHTAQPKREPLSEDVIWDNMPENPMECSALAFIRGVKFAEKAHGIGGGE